MLRVISHLSFSTSEYLDKTDLSVLQCSNFDSQRIFPRVKVSVVGFLRVNL